MIYKFRNFTYDFNERTYIMGVLNITPDSFSDGGLFYDGKAKIDFIYYAAKKMEADGADFIDVGGESTRPGSDRVSTDEECERILPVIKQLSETLKIPISVDTYKHEVAEEALKAGAEIINDISGLNFDSKMADTISNHNAACILMHIKGVPKTMQNNPVYENVTEEVLNYLIDASKKAKSKGINRIIIDPGIGFGKKFEHNIQLIKNLKRFRYSGYPVLIGLSRKSFINYIYESEPKDRLEGTLSANTAGILYGANILRVHDVLENKRIALTADALKQI